MSPRRTFALAACALAFAAAPAIAQSAPGIYVSPPDGLQTSSPAVAVEILWSHETALNGSSRSIRLGASTITSGFSYTLRPREPDGPVTAISRDTITLAPGINTLAAAICGGASGGECAADTVRITYTPAPSPTVRADPVLSLAPHNGAFRDFTAEAATASYGAPGYVSMGQPQALSLFYSSALAEPRPLLQVDVRDPSQDPAQAYSIKVRLPGAAPDAWLTQSNGLQEAYYARGAATADSVSRLAVQLLPGSLPTGMHRLVVEVTSHWTSPAATESADDTVNVLVLNRQDSPFGRGWWVRGLQEAYSSSRGVLIDEGGGAASFFQAASGGYVSPPGDESTLAASGDSLVRRYPDGTRTVFGPAVPAGTVRRHLYTRTKLGRTVSYTYTGNLLSAVTDPAGKQTVLAYTTQLGRTMLSSVTSPGGRAATWVRDSTQTQIFDADGVRGLQQVHTSAGRQSVVRYRDNGAWSTTYTAFGTAATLQSPAITLNGAAASLITRFTSPLEAMLPAAGQGASGAPLPRVAPGAPHARIVGPAGDTTRVWTDRFGLPERAVDPLGRVSVVRRDGRARPTLVVVDGDSTRMSYNDDGTVKSRYDQSHDDLVTYTYQSAGGATFLAGTSRAGTSTTYHRNALGAVDSIRVENRTVARFTYDADYQVRTVTDAEGHLTEYFYAGNPWRNADSVRAGGQRTASTYDAYGRTATLTDALGRTTTLVYDALDRVTRQSMGADSVRYVYNAQGVQQVRDAAGKQYQYARNALGWVDDETDPQGRKTYYAYDPAGNVVTTTDRWGRVFRATYDVAGRRTMTISADNDTTRYTYPNKRVMTVANRESADTLVYDGAGLLVDHTVRMGTHSYTLANTYDGRGARSSAVIAGGNRWAPAWMDSVGYTHDAEGRLGTIVTNVADLTIVGYDDDGLPTSIGFPGGMATLNIGYTPRHAMSSAQYDRAVLNTAFDGGTLSYDLLDRLTMRTNVNDTRQREHSYDAQGRLSGSVERKLVTPLPPAHCQGSASEPECVPQPEWTTMRLVTYALDVVGNRTGTTYADSTGASGSQSATLQPLSNRYATYGGWTLQYDTVGNLVSRTNGTQQYRYRWNSVGQLRSVVTPAGDSVAYGYNGLGMRVRRTQGGVTTRYLYNGADLAAEVDGSGNPIRTYRHWPGIDQPHSMQQWSGGAKTTQHFYALDLPGSTVRGLFYAQGFSTLVSQRYSYGPFGEPQAASGSTGNPLRFAARELDATTGLYYVRARWYEPSMGRFVSEDPIGLAGGINNYAYAANDPVNLSDPTGLCYKRGWVIVGGGEPCPSTRGLLGLSFLIDRWNGARSGDGTASMAGVAYSAAPGWQDDGSMEKDAFLPESEGPGVWLACVSTVLGAVAGGAGTYFTLDDLQYKEEKEAEARLRWRHAIRVYGMSSPEGASASDEYRDARRETRTARGMAASAIGVTAFSLIGAGVICAPLLPAPTL